MGKPVSISDITFNSNSILTVGTFDGVHKGHQAIIKQLATMAKTCNCRSVVVTFDPHPREIINTGSDKIRLLTTLQERAEVLSSLGVDQMVVIPFTRDFSLLSSSEFIEDILLHKIGISGFIIGYDHQFGRNREGTIAVIKDLGNKHNFKVHIIEAQEVDHTTVSSTLIRNTLETTGEVGIVRDYLGRNYEMSGLVIHGNKRGRLLGYPTANISLTDSRKVIPKNGVYAVNVRIEKDPTRYKAMMNIGFRPTFSEEKQISLEVHIFDFNQEIYGKTMTVEFISRIREEMTFPSIQALQEQLGKDQNSCITINI
jgi:riboflavin kinase/FMN adenylyltransferase